MGDLDLYRFERAALTDVDDWLAVLLEQRLARQVPGAFNRRACDPHLCSETRAQGGGIAACQIEADVEGPRRVVPGPYLAATGARDGLDFRRQHLALHRVDRHICVLT